MSDNKIIERTVASRITATVSENPVCYKHIMSSSWYSVNDGSGAGHTAAKKANISERSSGIDITLVALISM